MTAHKNDAQILLKVLEEQARLLQSMYGFIHTMQGLLKVALKTSDVVSTQYQNHLVQLNKLREDYLAAANENIPINESDPASQ